MRIGIDELQRHPFQLVKYGNAQVPYRTIGKDIRALGKPPLKQRSHRHHAGQQDDIREDPSEIDIARPYDQINSPSD